jgi:hypothetical protein
VPHGFVSDLERAVIVVAAFTSCMAVAVVKIVDMVFVVDGGVAAVGHARVRVFRLVVPSSGDSASQGA